jgi:DNA sulfur modification protein DndB
MGINTQIPAFFATVGDWRYYVCVMTYAQVANQVNFQYELDTNRDLARIMQRGITDRTEDIRQYLLNNEHRFLGALVVAVWGGDPKFQEMELTDPSAIAPNLDEGVGVLIFDGTQQYFALDGQHRLRAIKDAVRQDPDLAKEQIAVLIVPHFHTEDGRERTRRLFTNINRTAKPTTKAENIAIDEDDGFAILTRQMISAHSLLKRDGLVKVFTSPPELGPPGTLKLAVAQIGKTEQRAWTNIGTFYEMLRSLGFSLSPTMTDGVHRPTDAVLSRSYATLVKRLEQLLASCGSLLSSLKDGQDVRELRAPDSAEHNGHPLMRPIVQKAVAQVARDTVDFGLAWDEVLQRLSALDWQLHKAPWTSVYNVASGRMTTGKDNKDLLLRLLRMHIAPRSKREIRETRKEYRALIGHEYPVSLEELSQGIRSGN